MSDCVHPSQRLLVVVGNTILYQCEECKTVITVQLPAEKLRLAHSENHNP